MSKDAVVELRLLSEQECGGVYRRVHELRERWTRRHPDLPFFSLGAASYLDASADGAAVYLERAAATNPLLAEHFGWLHERLRLAVEEHVGAPCEHAPDLALPGFHVFEHHPSFGKGIASKHYDLQYQDLDWSPIGRPEPSRQLSLTLPVRVPSGGAALRVWGVSWDEVRDADTEQRRRLANAHRTPQVHAYREGRLVVHSGHLLHQIAPFRDPRQGDERMTLQAHALPVDRGDRWVLYW